MRSIALTVAMWMVAILLPTPVAAQAQLDQWTSSPQAKIHWNLAYQALRAGDNVHAAEEFRLATQADPKFAEAYYYRGLVLVLHAFPNQKKTPPPAAAAESFQMYLALKPTGSLAVDSLSMLKELGLPPRSEEGMRNANSTLAAKPQAAPLPPPQPAPKTALAPPQTAMTQKPVPTPQSAPPQKPVPVQQPGPTQQSRATPQPLAPQNRVDVPRETAVTKPPPQLGASSSRASDPAPAIQNPSRVASPAPSSLAANSALPKPSNTPYAAATVPRPVAASTQCVRYQITRSGQCGTPDEVEIRAWNPCAQPSAIQVCVEETSGHWNCAMSLHSHRRKTYTGVDGARQYVCHGTGRTRALSLPSGQDLPIFPPLSR